MDEEQQDDIPPRMVELDEIQQQAQAAREQPGAEPALADAPTGGVVGAPLIDVSAGPAEEAFAVKFDLPEDAERQDQAAVDVSDAAAVQQEVVDAPEQQAIQQKFAEIVGDMNRQAGAVQQVMAIEDPMAQVPRQGFVQPERGKGERYVAYRNRVRELRKQHNAQQPVQEEFAINAVPPKLVPAADIAQQAQAAREVDAPQGNAVQGAGRAAAAPGGKVALDLDPPDLERLTREGEDTSDQLVERFRQFIEQTRRFNHSLLIMLDSATAAMAQDHALLEQIRSRFERTREG